MSSLHNLYLCPFLRITQTGIQLQSFSFSLCLTPRNSKLLMSPLHLIQKYSCLTSSESTDSAFAMCTGKTSKSAKLNKCCTYKLCCKQGHLEADCQMKKCDQNKQDDQRKRTRKERRLLSILLKIRLSLKVPLWPLSSNHHFILTIIIKFMFSLPLKLSSFFFMNPAIILSLTLAVPTTSVHNHEYFLDDTFTTLKKSIKVYLGDALTIQATEKGSLHYLMDTPKGAVFAIIINALYVPEFTASLLLVACFTNEDSQKHWLCYYRQILWLLHSHHI